MLAAVGALDWTEHEIFSQVGIDSIRMGIKGQYTGGAGQSFAKFRRLSLASHERIFRRHLDAEIDDGIYVNPAVLETGMAAMEGRGPCQYLEGEIFVGVAEDQSRRDGHWVLVIEQIEEAFVDVSKRCDHDRHSWNFAEFFDALNLHAITTREVGIELSMIMSGRP